MSFPTLELTATNMYFGSGIKLSHIRYFLSCFYISTSNTIETQRKLIKWFRNSTFIAFFMIWYVMKGGTVSSIYFLFCVNSLFINMFDTIHSYINFCICMYMYMYIWLLATVNVWYKNMDLFRKNIRCCYHKIIKSVNVAFYRSLDRNQSVFFHVAF
jgi:hypothetical protein